MQNPLRNGDKGETRGRRAIFKREKSQRLSFTQGNQNLLLTTQILEPETGRGKGEHLATAP